MSPQIGHVNATIADGIDSIPPTPGAGSHKVSYGLTGLVVFVAVLIAIICAKRNCNSHNLERRWSSRRKNSRRRSSAEPEFTAPPKGTSEDSYISRNEKKFDWKVWVDDDTKCCIEKDLLIDESRIYIIYRIGIGKDDLKLNHLIHECQDSGYF